ncbi:hypothetical protein AFLA_001666 [Aspergillus flavus NRRL3357]|nr:hypothetical protein AFLA_001666 [Aspergillus flavus NRRL3357]
MASSSIISYQSTVFKIKTACSQAGGTFLLVVKQVVGLQRCAGRSSESDKPPQSSPIVPRLNHELFIAASP